MFLLFPFHIARVRVSCDEWDGCTSGISILRAKPFTTVFEFLSYCHDSVSFEGSDDSAVPWRFSPRYRLYTVYVKSIVNNDLAALYSIIIRIAVITDNHRMNFRRTRRVFRCVSRSYLQNTTRRAIIKSVFANGVKSALYYCYYKRNTP